MKNILFFFLTSLVFTGIYAQKNVNITGKVIDKDTNQPLEYATVVVTPTNGDQITGGITDTSGNFNIEVKKGEYNISVEFISFKTHKFPKQELSADKDFGTIYLSMDSHALEEVEIIAEKTTVELRLDKKIYNVGKDLTVSGGNVSDVLDNVPSVSVDVEGNVALRGNDNVRILINGKPSGLVGLNSTDALRQLPAEAIEKVEIITSPSARYDAEGTAGILNIILRRSKMQGVNGAITATVGHPTSAGLSGNINYRVGDFNFFNTSGYRYRESPGHIYNYTEYLNTTPTSILEEDRERERQSKGFNTNFGVEYHFNDNTSLTGTFLYRDSDEENNTTNHIFQRDQDGNETRSIRKDPELEDDKTIQYALNFDKKFKTDGHKLTADFQYENSGEDENSLITQDGKDIERVETIERQDRFLLQSDYVLPIGEDSQFEFGYRGNFENMDTDYTLEEADSTGTFILNDSVSNNLIYDENVNALYAQYGSKINKFSYLLGLRYEHTNIGIDQRTSSEKVTKNYGEFFPTINLSYELTEKQSFTLGYNRRIRRPWSRFINPFPSRSSATNIFQGNPDIDPSFSNGIDLGYLNRMKDFTINSSIYYTHSTDVFNFISEPTGEEVELNGQMVPVIRRTPINLSTNDRIGFEFTLTYNPTKNWRINGNFNFFKSITEGEHNGRSFDANDESWFVRLNNKLTLPLKIDWQTRLFYRGPSEDAQSRRKGMFSTNMAFSKDILNERASIVFNVSDLFNTRKRESEEFATDQNGVPIYQGVSEFQWRPRSFSLSFTYRFNQKKKPQRERQESFDDEREGFEG